MRSFIPGFESTDEAYAILWMFWRHKFYSFKNLNLTALPFISDKLMRLEYTSLSYFPSWSFFVKLMSILTNEVFIYNLIIIISFLFSGLFMFSLVYYCSNSTMVSILSGIIYAFCPYHFARAWQHMTLAQIQWFPLYILTLFNLYKKINSKNIVFCIVAFLLFVYTDFYSAYFATLITPVFLFFIFSYNWKEKFRLHNFAYDVKMFKSVLLIIIIVFLISLPFTFPILKTVLFTPKTELISNLGYRRNFNDLFEQSAKILSYFLPQTAHPMLGKHTEKLIGSELYGKSFTEHTLYLGWTPLILTFIAFRRWRRRRFRPIVGSEDFYISFFVFLAVAAWFISQPPWWKMGAFKIYMPSFFLHKIMPMFRAYCRFGIILMLAVAALAGFGLKFVLEKFKSQKTKIAIASFLCGLVIFEFWNYPPLKVINVSGVPAVYYWIKEQPQDFVIADYPLDTDTSNDTYKFYQTKHGKKNINGTFPGSYANKVIKTIIKLSLPNTASVLKWLGVKYVLVHKEDYLKTGLVEQIEELNEISKNPGLKLIKTFPPEHCSQGIICTKETGPIDVYEVVTKDSIEPNILNKEVKNEG